MSEIREGTLSEILRRRLMIAGQDAPPSDLSPELSAVIPLEVDRPEWGFLSGERLCMGVVTQVAVAAERAQIQIFNPANSGVICVLDEIIAATTTANPTDLLFVRYYDAALGSRVDSRVSRDRRWDGPAGGNFRFPMTELRVLSSGTVFGSVFYLMKATAHVFEAAVTFETFYEFNRPVILNPSTGLTIAGDMNNRALAAAFSWRERKMTAWEAPSPP